MSTIILWRKSCQATVIQYFFRNHRVVKSTKPQYVEKLSIRTFYAQVQSLKKSFTILPIIFSYNNLFGASEPCLLPFSRHLSNPCFSSHIILHTVHPSCLWPPPPNSYSYTSSTSNTPILWQPLLLLAYVITAGQRPLLILFFWAHLKSSNNAFRSGWSGVRLLLTKNPARS